MLGRMFGRFTVIGSGPVGIRGVSVYVRCECGRIGVRPVKDLNDGRATECKSCEEARNTNEEADYEPPVGGWKYTAKITFQGRTMRLSEWAKTLGINESTLRGRLNNGWTVWRALTDPITKGKRPNRLRVGKVEKSVEDWAREAGVTRGGIHARLRRGWSPEKAVSLPAQVVEEEITFRGQTKKRKEWAREAGISDRCLKRRLELGWSLEDALERPRDRRARRYLASKAALQGQVLGLQFRVAELEAELARYDPTR